MKIPEVFNASLIKVKSNGVAITSGFATIGLKGTHVLKAVYNNRLLTLYVDGNSIYTYTDTRSAEPTVADAPGKAGFRLSKSSLNYYKVKD